MIVKLPWGSNELELEVPDSWNVIFPAPPDTILEAAGDETLAVTTALDRPNGAVPLSRRSLAGKKILIVVDDNTRPTPVHRFFHLLLAALEQAGAETEQMTVMPALGIHTPMTADEMAAKIGLDNLKRVQWRNHDAFDQTQLEAFGTTRRGTPVILNRAVTNADLIVTLGLVEPHLWAGFGGGLKNILPGIAAAETIGRHHAIISEPPYPFNQVGVEPDANAFRLELEEIQGMIAAPVFCLNVCLDRRGKIVNAFSGDPIQAHRAGVAFNRLTAGRRLDRQVDALIVNSYPMDFNFKQSMKGVSNALPALKPRGVVMGFLRAEHGIDDITPPEKAKSLWLVKRILRLLSAARIMWFLEKTRPGLDVEEKFLLYYAMQLIRQYDLLFHVPTLNDHTVRRLGFFRNFPQPQDVVRAARRKLPHNAEVAVFTEAGATIPLMV